MFLKGWKIVARKGTYMHEDIEIFMYNKERMQYIKELIVTETKENYPIDPIFELETHEAQMLMDTLWDCGIRPSEGSGSAGALAAVQKHLEDMRKIAFKYLGI